MQKTIVYYEIAENIREQCPRVSLYVKKQCLDYGANYIKQKSDKPVQKQLKDKLKQWHQSTVANSKNPYFILNKYKQQGTAQERWKSIRNQFLQFVNNKFKLAEQNFRNGLCTRVEAENFRLFIKLIQFMQQREPLNQERSKKLEYAKVKFMKIKKKLKNEMLLVSKTDCTIQKAQDTALQEHNNQQDQQWGVEEILRKQKVQKTLKSALVQLEFKNYNNCLSLIQKAKLILYN